MQPDRRPPRLFALAAFAVLTCAAAGRADDDASYGADLPVEAPKPITISPGEIPQLIADLDSESYATRQQATALLTYGGGAAVEPLARAAREGSPEAATRAVRILEMLYTGGNEETYEAAGEALERLTEGGSGTVAGRAWQAIQMHGDLREQRAIAAIERLGGVVKYDEREIFMMNAPHRSHKPISVVIINIDWRGGDEGLKHVKRIDNLPWLYVCESRKRGGFRPVSDEAVEELMAEMPGLQYAPRGAASLGVRSDPQLPRCTISAVDPGTPAAKAGLREYDTILSFGGDPTPSFQTLVDLIRDKYEPGDDVEVEILRGAQPMTLTVALDKWKSEGTPLRRSTSEHR